MHQKQERLLQGATKTSERMTEPETVALVRRLPKADPARMRFVTAVQEKAADLTLEAAALKEALAEIATPLPKPPEPIDPDKQVSKVSKKKASKKSPV